MTKTNSDYMPQPLSHTEIQQMLDAHQKYFSSKREEGQKLDLTGYIIEGFDFSGLELPSLSARISIFIRCDFKNCNLYGAYFNGSEFTDVDFSDANLAKVEFNEIKAKKTCFDRAKLYQAEFMYCKFADVSFLNADLNSSIISDSELIRTCFGGADIEGAAIDNNKEDGTSWGNLKE
jgi:uncharacterized protein YjbI with pentapeptide repeats